MSKDAEIERLKTGNEEMARMLNLARERETELRRKNDRLWLAINEARHFIDCDLVDDAATSLDEVISEGK